LGLEITPCQIAAGKEISAYVLTLLPGRGFQVFQVVGEEEKREKGEFIDNLFTSIILIHIYCHIGV
jgi:hypothetical protein